MYQDNARRLMLQQQAGDVGAYLRSLDMEIIFQPFDETGRARITQLINKSNQFNLTTRRYSEAEVAEVARDGAAYTLQIRLTDAFGDNGMISVIICRPSAKSASAWDIDTWLMSCRVLGRKVEEAVLNELALAAGERGIKRLIGTYRPTSRNQMVAEHYAKLGFTELERLEDGTTRWFLDVARIPEADLPMRVRRLGLALAEG
jgi:FkbH-like protein